MFEMTNRKLDFLDHGPDLVLLIIGGSRNGGGRYMDT